MLKELNCNMEPLPEEPSALDLENFESGHNYYVMLIDKDQNFETRNDSC